MTALLDVHSVAGGYQGRPVVRNFDLTLEAGEIVALLGPNGAGKTTILLTLGGLLPMCGGSGHVAGHAFDCEGNKRQSYGRALKDASVVLVPDDRSLFTSLTTRENLTVAARKGGMPYEKVIEYFPPLEPRLKTAAGMLSGGEQQMLALGRALIQAPEVLLVDELSMGLAPRAVATLLPLLQRIATEEGTAILLVEQHTRLALETASRAIVLAHGATVLTGDASDLLADNEALERAYFGHTNDAPGPNGARAGDTALEVEA